MINQLRTLGIEKGKPFAPDALMKARLDAGIREAQVWLDVQYEASFLPFAEGSRWSLPVSMPFIEEIQSAYADSNKYYVDVRGVTYTFGFIGIKRLGSG
jgi:hypothetical protein